MRKVESVFHAVQEHYGRLLDSSLRHRGRMMAGFAVLLLGALALFYAVPSEYAPREDRGAFFLIVNGPEGASARNAIASAVVASGGYGVYCPARDTSFCASAITS